ncbi:UBX domain-containing protein 2A [Pteropus alecto]|uniref:UBX domain-containing protein 2A n=1 Tax=Pteropus alecto TaxID=9402 RepID=L5KRE7_PTEAL|nr:UBX domain-containing protein 2A [Pteropus alecto]
MKEVDNLESIKEEWVCETGSDNQPLSDNQQTTCEYFVDSLFEEAQKIGARCLSPTEQKKQVDISIKLWKNGFTVNDDFRSYSDGASRQFLNSIKKGELPLELEGTFDKEEVDVKVEDKKNEVCVSTKPVFQPFSGQGHRLGSATPKIVFKGKSNDVTKKNNLFAVPLNKLEPITNIQIWLANGKRIVQKFNISHRFPSLPDTWVSDTSPQATSTPHAHGFFALLGSDTVSPPQARTLSSPALGRIHHSWPLLYANALLMLLETACSVPPLLLPLSVDLFLTPLGFWHSTLDSSPT